MANHYRLVLLISLHFIVSKIALAQGQPILHIRGLSEFFLIGQWTERLLLLEEANQDPVSGQSEIDLSKAMLAEICPSSLECLPLSQIEATLTENYGKPSKNSEAYVRLARALILTRRVLMEGDYSFSLTEKRKLNFLFQLFAEEVLFVGSQLFPSDFPTTFLWRGDTHSNVRSIEFQGLTVPNGAVLNSRGNALSSALIQFYGDVPGIASHSYQAWIEPMSNEGFVSESLIETGVRLNDLHAGETLAALYVPKDSEQQVMYSNCIDYWANRMTKSEDGSSFKASDYRKVQQPSYTCYDFTFNPSHVGDEKCYACSTWLQYTQERCRQEFTPDQILPFPEEIWSESSGILGEFLTVNLGLASSRFPNPTDMEMNQNFTLSALRIDISSLASARISQAAIDVLLHAIEQNEESVRKIMAATAKIGNGHADTNLFEKAISEFDFTILGMSQKEADGAKIKAIERLKLIPNGATYKQVVLVAWLQFIVEPEIKKYAEKQAGDQGKILNLIELRQDLSGVVNLSLDKLVPAIDSLLKNYSDFSSGKR
jgi:hypothetical protein